MSHLRLRDLIRARLQHDSQFESDKNITLAKIVKLEGSIDAGPAYNWLNLWGDDGAPATAFNPGVTVQAGDWVKVARDPKDPFRWTILGIWAGDIDPEYLTRVSRHEIGLHGKNHQIPTEATTGIDPVKIYQPALQQFKTTGNGTNLTVTVSQLIYMVYGVRRVFNGTTFDLTSSVPSTTGEIRAVLIYLNTDTNIPGTRDGTAVPDSGPYPIVYPSPFSYERASAYVILSYGQTTVTTADDVLDSRDFLSGDSDFLPVAEEEGQVMMVDETLNWTAESPMISEDDAWMVGDDDLLVVV